MIQDNKLIPHLEEFFLNLEKTGKWSIDNSEYEQWQACMTKGLFYGVLRKKPAGRNIALVFGGAFHEAMEAHLNGKSLKEQLTCAFEFAEREGMALISDKKRNFDTLESIVRLYNADYNARSVKFKPLDLGDGKLAVEQTFELPVFQVTIRNPFTGNMVPLTIFAKGKIDLVTHHSDGKLWVVDHKTTSIMGEQFTADKAFGSQFQLYTWAWRKIMAELDPTAKVGGAIINAAAIRASGVEFKQFELPFPQWQVDDFIQEFITNVRLYLRELINSVAVGISHSLKDFPASRTSCVTKYGACTFLSVCPLSPAARYRALMDTTMFEDNKWNVLNS